MVALIAALQDTTPLLLGVDLPIEEIARYAFEQPQAAVGISVSTASDARDSRSLLKELRGLLPAATPLVAGGEGLHPGDAMEGIQEMDGLEGFERWILDRRPSPALTSGA